MRTIFKYIKKLFVKEKYTQKCQNNQHYGQVIIPTFSRKVISIDGPCECGYYQGDSDFLEKQHQKREQILQDIKENK